MPIANSLTSFEGRMRRRDFWVCVLIVCVLSLLLRSIVGLLMGPTIVVSNGNAGMNITAWGGMTRGYWLINLILLWPSAAIAVKRCHDRNQTGWWALLSIIPVIGWLWWLINLGILDGTPGPNQYGPSPKGLGETA